jgi:hypothetical protein
MIDVSYILVYVSETMVGKLKRIQELVNDFDMKMLDYVALD